LRFVKVLAVILVITALMAGCGLYAMDRIFDAVFALQMEQLLQDEFLAVMENDDVTLDISGSVSDNGDESPGQESLSVVTDGEASENSSVSTAAEEAKSSGGAFGKETESSVGDDKKESERLKRNAGKEPVSPSDRADGKKTEIPSGKASGDALDTRKNTEAEGHLFDQKDKKTSETVTLDKINSIKAKVSLEDKAKVISILLSRLTSADVDNLKEIAKGGVSSGELNEVKRILKSRITEEEKDILIGIYKKYISLLNS